MELIYSLRLTLTSKPDVIDITVIKIELYIRIQIVLEKGYGCIEEILCLWMLSMFFKSSYSRVTFEPDHYHKTSTMPSHQQQLFCYSPPQWYASNSLQLWRTQ